MSVIPGGSDRYIASWARWETIRYAIDDNGRTARLIMLLLVPILGAVLSLLIMVLTSHYGLGPGSVPRQANPAATASATPSRTVCQAGPGGRPPFQHPGHGGLLHPWTCMSPSATTVVLWAWWETVTPVATVPAVRPTTG